MRKSFLVSGIILAGLAVALGAFGAHGLKKVVDEQSVEVFKTGVQYQFYHSLALILTGILSIHFSSKQISWAGTLFIWGIILFSGSLYAITAFKAMGSAVPKFVGPVTPLGGLLFIAGWICLLIAVIKRK
ncbi:MAG: DUF423 domain-containing protein [Bacteroidetes bacterium]|nr:MAG: DUF423 domain-containing protein [Bacteroidota bacterium]